MKRYLKVAGITLAVGWLGLGLILALFGPQEIRGVKIEDNTIIPVGNTPCAPGKHVWGPWSQVMQETVLKKDPPLQKHRTCLKCGAYYVDIFRSGSPGLR